LAGHLSARKTIKKRQFLGHFSYSISLGKVLPALFRCILDAGQAVSLTEKPNARRAMRVWTPVLLALALCVGSSSSAGSNYIAFFRDELSLGADELSALLAAAPGGPIVPSRIITSLICSFAASLTDEQLLYLEAHGALIEDDLPTHEDEVLEYYPTQRGVLRYAWGLDRIDQRTRPLDGEYNPDPGLNGAGVDLFVLDSGTRGSHIEFAGRMRDGYDFFNNDRDADDCNGHGTHTAGIAAGSTVGVCRECKIHPVRITGCSGSGLTSHMAAALVWVAEHPAANKLITMSVSAYFSWYLNELARKVVASGVTIVVASGNNGADACAMSPGSEESVITVGASNVDDEATPYSNSGACVTIFAPGHNIISAWHTADNHYDEKLGTSMAAPFVTGVAALHAARLGATKATPERVRAMILADAAYGVLREPRNNGGSRAVPNILVQIARSRPWPPPMPPAPPSPAISMPVLTVITRAELQYVRARLTPSFPRPPLSLRPPRRARCLGCALAALAQLFSLARAPLLCAVSRASPSTP
jgi:hypothetical protein